MWACRQLNWGACSLGKSAVWPLLRNNTRIHFPGNKFVSERFTPAACFSAPESEFISSYDVNFYNDQLKIDSLSHKRGII